MELETEQELSETRQHGERTAAETRLFYTELDRRLQWLEDSVKELRGRVEKLEEAS